MTEPGDVVHLVNRALSWHLRETADGVLTDGEASEDLQRDVVHQLVQWLGHFPERLPKMEALTTAGRAALSLVRRMDLWDGKTRR